MSETQRIVDMAKPSVKDAIRKIGADLVGVSAAGVTGTWVATVQLNSGGAIAFTIGLEQRIKLEPNSGG